MTHQSTIDTAKEVLAYLGIPSAVIDSYINQGKSSIYITYKNWQLRISDHCENPRRAEAIKICTGLKTLSIPNNWTIAKNWIDRYIFEKEEIIVVGAIMNHPSYGQGIVENHDPKIGKVDVRFGEILKFFDANTIIDRGYIAMN